MRRSRRPGRPARPRRRPDRVRYVPVPRGLPPPPPDRRWRTGAAGRAPRREPRRRCAGPRREPPIAVRPERSSAGSPPSGWSPPRSTSACSSCWRAAAGWPCCWPTRSPSPWPACVSFVAAPGDHLRRRPVPCGGCGRRARSWSRRRSAGAASTSPSCRSPSPADRARRRRSPLVAGQAARAGRRRPPSAVRVYRTVLFEAGAGRRRVARPEQPPPGRLPAVGGRARLPRGGADRRHRRPRSGPSSPTRWPTASSRSSSSTTARPTAPPRRRAAAGADQVRRAAPRTGARAPRCAPACSRRRGRTVAFTDADLAYAPDQLARPARRGRGGLGRGGRAAAATPRPTTLVRARPAARGRRPGHQPAHPGRAARPLPRHPVRAQGVPLRRRPARCSTQARVDGFAFDVEVFHLVERYGLSLAEVPVAVVELRRARRCGSARDARRGSSATSSASGAGRPTGGYDLTPAERPASPTSEPGARSRHE